MKKLLSILLCAMLLLGMLAGCGGSGEENTQAATFSVGYGKAVISPETSVYLCGYGDAREDRMSTGTAENLYSIATAITDAKGQTVIIIAADLLLSSSSFAEPIRMEISEKAGVPLDNVMFHCTHNHSGPDASGDLVYRTLLTERTVQAALDAMADRKPATIETTFTRPEGINFVRHYLKVDGNYQGEGVGAVPKENLIGHYGKADNLMQLVRFVREGDAKDIVMINWQGHPRGTEPHSHTTATCNYPGIMRDTVDAGLDCQSIFILSGSGNLNNNSQIKEEVADIPDFITLGKVLGQHAIDAAANFKPANTGDIQVAKSFVAKDGKESTEGRALYAISMGDLAFAFAPFEIFDTNAMGVKEGSDFKMTFYASCSNTSGGYLPTDPSWDWEQHYEVRITNYPKGTCWEVQNILLNLLDKCFTASGNQVVEKEEGYITPEFQPYTDGVEYLNLSAGDPSGYTAVANGFYQVALMKGTEIKIMLALNEDVAKQINEKTTMKLMFNEQHVIVGLAE